MATGRKNTRTEKVEKVITEEVEVTDGITLELNDEEAAFLMAVVDCLSAAQPHVMPLYRALVSAGVPDQTHAFLATNVSRTFDHDQYERVHGQLTVVDKDGKALYTRT